MEALLAKNPVRKVKPSIKVRGDTYLAILTEEKGHRNLEMNMDNKSCAYMAAALSKKEVVRVPMLNTVLENCLNCLQANIRKVVIYAIENGRFLAKMMVIDHRDQRTYTLEIYVIDGIISAIMAGCPILVTEEVFKQYKEIVERMGSDFFTLQAQEVFDSITSGSGIKM